MKKSLCFASVVYALVVSVIANSYMLLLDEPRWMYVFVPLLVGICLFAGMLALRKASLRWKACGHGAVLLAAFGLSVCFSIAYHVVLAALLLLDRVWPFIWSALVCIGVQALAFWIGILCVYLTSVQLGVKQRVIGIVCGMIPIANVVALAAILRIVFAEVCFETEKEQLDHARQAQRVCETRYPILLVHGVFFRDTAYFNYWGRIPAALERNGATIYYGNHASAASVADSAAQLTTRIKEIVAQNGCEKVNIIAHSKGGLDCRYALDRLGVAPYVASLTTVNTPHRGCLFADYLLDKVSVAMKNKLANVYNSTLKKFGEENPDFLAAVGDLTAEVCERFDRETPAPAGVFCQSIGSLLSRASDGQFPLNFSHHLVRWFDGANDGLVSEKSFAWGEKHTLLTTAKPRGISHGDVIDLNRQNIEGFDVREFYVTLVNDLKNRGL